MTTPQHKNQFMGFPNLFKLIPKGQKYQLYQLKDKRIVLDGYNFAYTFASRLAVSVLINNDASKAIQLFRQLIQPFANTCQHVYLLWDGQLLPCKAITSITRLKQRERHLGEAMQQIRELRGKPMPKSLFKLLKKGFKMPKNIVEQVNEAMCQMFPNKVTSLFAPFEADQQMKYMFQQNQVDVIVSGDSDMIIYGVQLLRDYDPRTKTGMMYDKDHFAQYCAKTNQSQQEALMKLLLLGCDYFPYRANCQYNARSKLINFRSAQCGKYGSIDRAVQSILCALFQFRYQMVYCYKTQTVRFLQQMPPDDAALLEFMPEFVVGTTDGYDVEKGGKYTKSAIRQLIMREVKREVVEVQQPSICREYGITIVNGLVKAFGQAVDLSVEPIHDQYIELQTEEIKKKVLYKPKVWRRQVAADGELDAEEEEQHEESAADVREEIVIDSFYDDIIITIE